VTLEQLYAKCGSVPCVKGCTDCCGPIWMLPEEWDRTGRPRDEAVILESGFLLAAQKDEEGIKPLCLFLGEDGCTVYEHRPLVCRLYAACHDMECPHGKRATPLIPRAEVRAMMRDYFDRR
jgi:Fe-S-cluster containining protein